MSEFAGTLGERVTVLTQTGRDTAGAPLPFAEGVAVWASITPGRLSTTVRGETVMGPGRWQVTMRSGPTVPAPGDQLRWGPRMLRVLARREAPQAPDRVILLTEEI